MSQVDAPVLIRREGSWSGLQWREGCWARGRLAPAEPGDDVVALLRAAGPPEVTVEAPWVARGAAYIRERFRAATARLPPDAAGLVPALVIGDTSTTPDDLAAAMTTAGMSHLSAVSGSNVAIVLAAALGLARLAGVRRRWRPVVACAVLAGFVVLARPEPSVVRAAVMGVVGLAGLTVSRRRAGVPALAGSVVVLLCWDPWLARSYGFALSVLATLGLLVLARPWGERIGALLPSPLRGWGPALAVPVAAQVMCAPVVVLLQATVSLVAIPANLVADPFVAPATILGVATAVVSVAWVDAAALLAWLALRGERVRWPVAAHLATYLVSGAAPLAAFLAHASLEAGEHQAGEGDDALQLMTVHSAKGLEFDAVFLTGIEEGLFPPEQSLADADGVEEERRLMYVAITRARKRLYLSFSQTRLLHGQTRYNVKSRFFDELPDAALKWITPRQQGFGSGYAREYQQAWQRGSGLSGIVGAGRVEPRAPSPPMASATAVPGQQGLRVCLLYTSDAADERSRVDLGGRRVIKKKIKTKKNKRKRVAAQKRSSRGHYGNTKT